MQPPPWLCDVQYSSSLKDPCNSIFGLFLDPLCIFLVTTICRPTRIFLSGRFSGTASTVGFIRSMVCISKPWFPDVYARLFHANNKTHEIMQDTEYESVEASKPAKRSASARRRRAAEVHNLSERVSS